MRADDEMTRELERTTLAALDHDGLVAAFARAYEDYVVPLRFDSERLRLHVDAHDIALAHSPLWRDRAGGFVALAMLGIRGDRGWIGGFGLAPAHRGRGLSHPLCAEVIDRASTLGLARLQLEVIEGNARAIATYERAGFVRTRALCSYRRAPAAASPSAELQITELDVGALAWSRRSAAPAWQREPASVLRMPALRAIACGDAIAVVQPTEDAVQVLALFADDDAAAARLLDAVASLDPDRPSLVVNEPEGSPAERAMARGHWSAIVRQHEMVLALDGASAQR